MNTSNPVNWLPRPVLMENAKPHCIFHKAPVRNIFTQRLPDLIVFLDFFPAFRLFESSALNLLIYGGIQSGTIIIKNRHQGDQMPLQKYNLIKSIPSCCFFFFPPRLRWGCRGMGPSPLSCRIQPPAPPLMHRLHQYLGTLVRALLHLPTVHSRTPLHQVMTDKRSRVKMICF